MTRLIAVLLLIITGSIIGCRNKRPVIIPSFYFWKNNVSYFTEAEKSYLDTFQVQKLYVKFFEVEQDAIWGNAPMAKTSLSINKCDSVNAEIIPVIFIKNEVMLHSSKGSLDSLAENIYFLLNKMVKRNVNAGYNEIQIDCDWTERSKGNYFYFLTRLKQLSTKTISTTLRLYPFKYPEKMGVPPVDKVTLMCYNLVNALRNESKNSILHIQELDKYLNKKSRYPLHVDVALPAYSWMLVYQKGIFKGIISKENEGLLNSLLQTDPLWYKVIKDTVINSYFLREGDEIKYEKVSADALYKACDLIKRNVAFDDSLTVSIFHLDEEKISIYSYEVFDSIYSSFRR